MLYKFEKDKYLVGEWAPPLRDPHIKLGQSADDLRHVSPNHPSFKHDPNAFLIVVTSRLELAPTAFWYFTQVLQSEVVLEKKQIRQSSDVCCLLAHHTAVPDSSIKSSFPCGTRAGTITLAGSE